MSTGYSDDRVELTPRMRDVLRCAAAGMTEREAAASLGVSPETVKSITSAMCSRLGARNKTQAVALGKDRGEL